MARRSPFPVWSIVPTSGWFVLLGIWLPLSVVTLRADNPSRDTLVWAIIGGSLVASATITPGIVFGATGRALWLWLAISIGSFAQCVGYFVFVESTAASYAPGGDLATGLGVAFLTIPIFLAVLILIWVGAALGGSAVELRKRTVARRLT